MVGAVFNVTKFNEALRAMSPDRVESAGDYNLEVYRESEEQDEQRVAHLKQLVFGAAAKEPAWVKHSRFIHHNINFKGIKRMVFCFSFPFMLQLFLLAYLYVRETSNYIKLQSISSEVSLLDANSYLSWVVNLEMQYVLMKRMLVEGLLEDGQMAPFGIQSLGAHLNSLMREPEMKNQLTLNFLRTRLGVSQTNFKRFYQQDVIEQTSLRILTHVANRQPAFEEVDMSGFDGLRLAQESLNSLFTEPGLIDGVKIGSVSALRSSAKEEVARWNILNPVYEYIERSRPCSPSRAGTVQRHRPHRGLHPALLEPPAHARNRFDRVASARVSGRLLRV